MRSEEMIKLLPSGLREVLQKMNLDVAGLQEIRLRAEQPAVILSHGKEYVSQTVIHRRQLEETLAYLGNYSLYAYEEEIRRGYLSLPPWKTPVSFISHSKTGRKTEFKAG